MTRAFHPCSCREGFHPSQQEQVQEAAAVKGKASPQGRVGCQHCRHISTARGRVLMCGEGQGGGGGWAVLHIKLVVASQLGAWARSTSVVGHDPVQLLCLAS